MDTLSFEQVDSLAGSLMLHIYINGQNLIDLVRKVELPFATSEGVPQIAGNYSGIPSRIALHPSKYLLGEFAYFNACGEEKRTLLTCTCGESGCWSLCARIEVKDTEIVWSNFSNNHRSKWLYESLGPFHFDKQQYIEAMSSVEIDIHFISPTRLRAMELREEAKDVERRHMEDVVRRIRILQSWLPVPLNEIPGAKGSQMVDYWLKRHHHNPDGRALFWALDLLYQLGSVNSCSVEFWEMMIDTGKELNSKWSDEAKGAEAKWFLTY